jgi:purine-binding chemotaxis protein CheW
VTTHATPPDGSVPQASELGRRLAGKYMTFQLDREEYGLEILKVREIIGLLEITRVPRTREFVRGVINLRGKVIPVVDLRLKFGMPPCNPTDQTVIIVVQCQVSGRPLTMGLLVDQVLEVLSVDAANVEPAPSLGQAGPENEFILGVGKHEKRIVFLLDIARILSRDEVGEVGEAAA